MPLAYRIAAGFCIVLLIMVILAGYHLVLFGTLSNEVLMLAIDSSRAQELILDIRGNLLTLTALTSKLEAYEGLTRDSEPEELEELGELAQSPEQYRDGIAEVRKEVAEFILDFGHLRLTQAAKKEAAILGDVWDEHLKRVGLRELRGTLYEPATSPESAVNQSLEPAERQLKELETVLQASREERQRDIIDSAQRAELAAQLAAFIALVAALAGSLLVGRSILRPMRRIAQGARALAGGDFTYRVKESGGQEVEALAKDFNVMAARISQLDQLKKDLVSNVSHDLKAPLASMQETTRLLLEELPGPLNAQQNRLLSLNLSSGERLSRMISDLLDLSRLEAGVVELPSERVDLGNLLKGTVEELENLLKEREQAFKLELPKRVVEVEGSPSALGQVMTNLLSNAFKFTPRGGALGARLEPFTIPAKAWRKRLPAEVQRSLDSSDVTGALVEVWDSGSGVPDKHKNRIFQRFHRVDSHRKGAQGTGLGLAIAAAIVTQHHGALWVEDRPEGGSSFKLLLWQRIPAVSETSP